MIDIQKLEELAKAVEVKDWNFFTPAASASLNPSRAAFLVGPRRVYMDRSEGFAEADAAFIAAANPAAVLELINELKVHRENPGIRAIQSLRGDVADLKTENEALRSQVDRLLDHCPDGECATCGEIICPHGGAMHFHHDGCPSCAQAEQEQQP